MFEAMRGHLHEFDPHQGGFEHDETFQDAIASYATCIRDANLPHEDKRTYIESCFDQWLDEHADGGFPQYFREALWEMCTTKDDYRYWKSLLQDRLEARFDSDRIYGEHSDDLTETWRRGDLTTPADEDELLDGYTETAWLRGYVELLDRLGEQAELGTILTRHYPASRHLCLRYARLLADEGEREAAITVAEYGTDAFSGSDTVGLREFLVDQYEETDPDAFRETLIGLFVERTDWTYYNRLKAATPVDEWQHSLTRSSIDWTVGGIPRRSWRSICERTASRTHSRRLRTPVISTCSKRTSTNLEITTPPRTLMRIVGRSRRPLPTRVGESTTGRSPSTSRQYRRWGVTDDSRIWSHSCETSTRIGQHFSTS
jgi:hypothetical protein